VTDAPATKAVPADYDLVAILRAAGSAPDAPGVHYIEGALVVPGVSQAALDAAVAAYDPATVAKTRLVAYAASARWARMSAGITVGGVAVDTSDESQNRIANAWSLLQASGASSIEFKGADGTFHTLTVDQFRALALAVGAHVQACFAAEAQVVTAIRADPPTVTTTAQVDAAFAAVTP
jgi:hypothetical protein